MAVRVEVHPSPGDPVESSMLASFANITKAGTVHFVYSLRDFLISHLNFFSMLFFQNNLKNKKNLSLYFVSILINIFDLFYYEP